MSTYTFIVGTANVPVEVSIAPGTDGSATGVMKLDGIP